MARVSISEAARLAGVSRGTMYKTYLNKGVISTSVDSSGKKCIDTSELLRVFGSLHGYSNAQSEVNRSEQPETPEPVPLSPIETAKDVEIKLLREQLEKSEQRERWMQSQLSAMSDTLKLLEHKPEPEKPARRWWQVLWK